MFGRLLCRFGFHKDETLEADGSPPPVFPGGMTLMSMGRRYQHHCLRCGRREPFVFWIERS
jgi:hypothetical protein